MADVSISMNRHALVDLVLYGEEHRVEELFRFVFRKMKDLKLPLTGRGFRKPPPGAKAPWPNLHEVKRWMDSLNPADPEQEEAMKFLCGLYYTCRARVRPALAKSVEAGEEEH